MTTDRSITPEHGSSAQKSIWHCIRMLAPFKKVEITENLPYPEADVISGEEQFYRFIKKIYLEMYEDPEEFLVPVKPYDEYLKTAVLKQGAEKAHYNDSRESSLRNTFQQAILFYAKFFYELGLKSEGLRQNDNALVISAQRLNEVYSSLEWTHLRKGNQARYEVLRKFGLEMEQDNEIAYIRNRHYPDMFLGLWVLTSAQESPYKYMNYLRLDYMGYYRKSPGIQDIIETLDDEHGRIILKVQDVLKNLDVRVKVKPLRSITSDFKWKVEYTLRGKSILGFYAAPGELTMCIYFNQPQNIEVFSKQLMGTDPDLFRWLSGKIPERLCKCRNNRRIMIGDQKRRICGLSNRAEINNPSERDAENCIRVIKMFRKL